MADRDLCANCAHWREEHYDRTGVFQGALFGCSEYQGIEPSDERAANKAAEVRASAKAIASERTRRAQTFYQIATDQPE